MNCKRNSQCTSYSRRKRYLKKYGIKPWSEMMMTNTITEWTSYGIFYQTKSYLMAHCVLKGLSSISKLILVLPHSNAEEERLFSIVRKNKTAFRPTLDPKGTLSSILTIKFAGKEPAHQFEPPKELLKKAKSATSEYNKMHSKKH